MSPPRPWLLASLTAAAALLVLGYALRGALSMPPDATSRSERSAPTSPAAAERRVVTMPDGERFEVPVRPRRVVASSARLIDYAAALLPPERIVGFPEQAIEYATLTPEQEAALAGAVRFDTYLAEPVLRLEPDLVLADRFQAADTHARLEEVGVPLLLVPHVDDWNDARATLVALGRALDEEERAARLIGELDARVDALREAARRRPALRAVVYANFGSQGFTAGDATSIHEVLTLAGLRNAVAESGVEGHANMTFEDLLRHDPDLIVVSRPLRAPAAHTGDRGGASEQLLLGTEVLQGLRAVRERRIVSLPAGLYATNSHRIVRAAEVLAAEVDGLLERLQNEGAVHQPDQDAGSGGDRS